MERRDVSLIKYNKNTGYYILGISIIIILIVIIYNHKLIFKPTRSMTLLEPNQIVEFDKNTQIIKSINNLYGVKNNLFSIGKGYKLEISFMIKIPNTSGSENFHSTYRQNKPIIRFGESPTIYFNHYDNKMKIFIKYIDLDANLNKVEREYLIEHRLHLQKWNHVLFSIWGKNINLVINGVSVKNKLLQFVPKITSNLNENVIIGEKYNNIIGKLKDVLININN